MKLIVFIFICLINASSFSFDFDEVADGIYVHYGYQEDSNENNKGDIANVGFIIGSESIAVIDTGGTPNIGNRGISYGWSRNIKTFRNVDRFDCSPFKPVYGLSSELEGSGPKWADYK